MMIEIDGLPDLVVAAEAAAWTGIVAFTLMAMFFLYLLVRPVRRRAARDVKRQDDDFDAAELRELVERIENRMDAIERIVAAERDRPARIAAWDKEQELAGQGPEDRRKS